MKGAFEAPAQPGGRRGHRAATPSKADVLARRRRGACRRRGNRAGHLGADASGAGEAAADAVRHRPAGRAAARDQRGIDRDVAITPDGTRIVYVRQRTEAADGPRDRSARRRAADAINSASIAISPFISPDSRWVGFFDGGELKKVSITGGPPLVLSRVQGAPRGASWGPDDTIVFATNDTNTGLLSVSEGGGEPKVLTKPDLAHGEQDHLFPSVLPGRPGRAVHHHGQRGPWTGAVAVLDLKTGQRKTLIRGGSQAEYVEPGYLVYAAAGTLRAVRFDLARLEVLERSGAGRRAGHDRVDGGGRLQRLAAGHARVCPGGNGLTGATRSLVWVDRQGHEEPITAPPRAYVAPRLSPDGTRVALDIRDQENDIWIWDLARQTLTRLTDAPAVDQYPGLDAGQPAHHLRVGARGRPEPVLAGGRQHGDRRAVDHQSQPPSLRPRSRPMARG